MVLSLRLAGVSSPRLAKSLIRLGLFAAAFIVAAGGPAAAADCKSDPTPNIDWQECNKDMLMLEGSDLGGANMAGANLLGTDLRNANLAGANLEKATLVRASLAGAKADKANLSRIEAYRASFAGISAQGASFVSAEAQRADFTGADLTGADFGKAELGRADFRKATITGGNFPLANLSRADFQGTTFRGPLNFDRAFLFLTRIEGLDLSAAASLSQWQVDLACGDANTKLPKGLTAPKTWPCKFTND